MKTQDIKEVLFALLEKAQVLSDTISKDDNNVAWLSEELHKLVEEFDLREAADEYDGFDSKNYEPDLGRGELPSPEEAQRQGATVFGGDSGGGLKS